MKIEDLEQHGAPPELVGIWRKQISQLTDIQEKAVRAGLLDSSKNLLAVAPTSSGKTFIGEVAATTSAFLRPHDALFIVPFRALAEEHYLLFRERYSGLLSVGISTSDHQEFDPDIRAGNVSLTVMTYEKLTGFLVAQPNFLNRCSTLVVDEVQSMSDPGRGSNLEIMLTQALRSATPPQIVALSASLDDLHELDTWLRAKAVISSERPVPLSECVCDVSGIALFPDGSSRRLLGPEADRDELALSLAETAVKDGKQVIVFRSSVGKVGDTADALTRRLPATGTSQQIDESLNELEDSESVGPLRACVSAGVGFHNADLSYAERRLVESAFRSGEIRALVSTTTLAMGVNLPTDVVVVADTQRWAPAPGGWDVQDISVAEYRNAAGRAGRLGQRSKGQAVLLADGRSRQLLNNYVLGEVEPVESQIPKRAFADVVCDLIACGIATSETAAVEFIAATFAYMTFYERAGGGLSEVRAATQAAIAECLATGLVVESEDGLAPTPAGRLFASAGLSLASAIHLYQLVGEGGGRLPLAALIYEVSACTELGGRPWLRRARGVTQPLEAEQKPALDGELVGSRLAAAVDARDERTGLRLAKTKCILDWIGGEPVARITGTFRGMGAGSTRIRDLGRSAAWLLETMSAVAQVQEESAKVVERLRGLALEARYGLPAPLAPLARLSVRGVTRKHLLALYRDERGLHLHTPEALLDRPDEDFEDLLTPTLLDRLRKAIVEDIHASLLVRRTGQRRRAEVVDLPAKLVDDLYTTTGNGLELAVADALSSVGLSVERVLRQPSGEEDIRLAHADGTVVISVTASKDDARPVRWNKAKEILGTGTGLNPTNYVCIARPSFDKLAESSAANIAREQGSRSILLAPVDIIAEAVVAISEGTMTADDLGALLARRRGILRLHDLTTVGE
jgi:helicase